MATIDVLRRAGIEVRSVSLTASRQVAGSHGVAVHADEMFDPAALSDARMAIIPGGTVRFNEHEGLRAWLKEYAAEGGLIAAICAAPMVLGGLGLLKGHRATCYPGFEKYLDGAILATSEAVVVDGNITTGRGPGLALEFALQLVRILAGDQTAHEVAKGLLLE
ncbi:MAG: DJ-1/PfpI family protein [Rikenellaceae bacterium]|nr:DJ-1/PfpI family protein [Rikenellaceae bacterium]